MPSAKVRFGLGRRASPRSRHAARTGTRAASARAKNGCRPVVDELARLVGPEREDHRVRLDRLAVGELERAHRAVVLDSLDLAPRAAESTPASTRLRLERVDERLPAAVQVAHALAQAERDLRQGDVRSSTAPACASSSSDARARAGDRAPAPSAPSRAGTRRSALPSSPPRRAAARATGARRARASRTRSRAPWSGATPRRRAARAAGRRGSRARRWSPAICRPARCRARAAPRSPDLPGTARAVPC